MENTIENNRLIKGTIYNIENLINGRLYIGSTTRIKKRLTRHINDLNAGKHHSYLLQNDWDLFGKKAFKINVLEEVYFSEKETLLNIEQKYIDGNSPFYNICKTAGSQLGSVRSLEFKKACSERMKDVEPWNKGIKTGQQSEDTIQKRSESLKGHKVDRTVSDKIAKSLSKPVAQFDKNENFIKQWDSAKQAATVLGFTYTALIKYLNGRSNINTFKGFIWKRQ